MTNRRAVPAENFASLLDCIQKGKLHAELCRWVGIDPPALAVALERLSA
jgi:hypothetical protein